MPDENLAKLHAYRSSLAAQDAILADAVKSNPKYEVPIPGNVPIKLTFDSINADYPNLVPPFVLDGQPGALRPQIALALHKIDSKIADVTATIRDSRNGNRLRVPLNLALARVAERLDEGQSLHEHGGDSRDDFVYKLALWVERTVHTLNRIFESEWHSKQLIDKVRPHGSRSTTTHFEQWQLSRHDADRGIEYLRGIEEGLSMTADTEGATNMTTPSRIFIGHGRSLAWRELEHFVSTRLKLATDEYNREPSAGLFTPERLQEMLNAASFALLVMTGEDEQPDASVRPRENVVHEAGLFQGKLGFRRAIILLEQGCSSFSNIHGLTVISFPRGNVASTFEDVRRTLEREGILKNKLAPSWPVNSQS